MEDCKWTLRLLKHRQEQVPIEFRFEVKVGSKLSLKLRFLVEKFWWPKWLLLEMIPICGCALDWSTEITAIKLFNYISLVMDLRITMSVNNVYQTLRLLKMLNGLITRDLSRLRQSWWISKHFRASRDISTRCYYWGNLVKSSLLKRITQNFQYWDSVNFPIETSSYEELHLKFIRSSSVLRLRF